MTAGLFACGDTTLDPDGVDLETASLPVHIYAGDLAGVDNWVLGMAVFDIIRPDGTIVRDSAQVEQVCASSCTTANNGLVPLDFSSADEVVTLDFRATGRHPSGSRVTNLELFGYTNSTFDCSPDTFGYLEYLGRVPGFSCDLQPGDTTCPEFSNQVEWYSCLSL